MQDFHFIISRTLYNFLRQIANRLNVTVNVLIRMFVNLTINQIDMLYQEYERQAQSIYESVDNGSGKRDIHIRLQHHIYKQTKWLHGHFNNYSQAQVVRRCIFLMLILMRQYGSFNGAVVALRMLDETTTKQQNSRDTQGFMHNFMGIPQAIRHLIADVYVSYGVIASFAQYMASWLNPPPQIEG